MTRQLIFMGVSFGILVVVCTAFAAFSFSLKLTSKEDLADLRLRQLAPTKFVLSFKIPLESFYSPLLVESKKLGDQTIVSVYKQLAVGTGIGLRLDFSYLVLRFDLATPVRKPYLAEDDRWVLKNFNLKDSGWRSENLILNIAVGYPF